MFSTYGISETDSRIPKHNRPVEPMDTARRFYAAVLWFDCRWPMTALHHRGPWKSTAGPETLKPISMFFLGAGPISSLVRSRVSLASPQGEIVCHRGECNRCATRSAVQGPKELCADCVNNEKPPNGAATAGNELEIRMTKPSVGNLATASAHAESDGTTVAGYSWRALSGVATPVAFHANKVRCSLPLASPA
jgi:hypothetical protein